MARTLRIEYENAFYHVIQRGIERRAIYRTDSDKEKFLKCIEESYEKYGSICHSYCLMDNHYHLIVQTPQANLKKIMHYINTSYVVYYNKKHRRVGPLYQGRYRSILIEAEEYLNYLSKYIHLNPVRAKIVKSPEEYKWTSYEEYVGKGRKKRWLETNAILGNFGRFIKESKKEYKEFVLDGIGKEEEIRKYMKDNTHKGIVLGSIDFFQKICNVYIEGKKDEEIPLLREIQREVDLKREDIEEKVRGIIHNEKEARKITIYLMRKYTQRSLKEIARSFKGIGDTGISILCKRVEKKRKKDKKLDKIISRIEKVWNVET
jgi:REP element-mobilizing transposase RayT